ncbi:hypothetical protein [Bordetella bronchiseptica]|uniref:hypothetical protein n=1 Tax=Bordetella bronchiseptica TaxID=518 RepID=UPI000460FC19|nr:hypothetical protein [Bordetella bronchiseptica]KDD09835.1 hypothetical protein L522_1800 [Bordetella bronchiseptica MBORD707]
MAIESINLGAVANDKTGDKLRDAGQKINANFAELDQREAATAQAAGAAQAAADAADTKAQAGVDAAAAADAKADSGLDAAADADVKAQQGIDAAATADAKAVAAGQAAAAADAKAQTGIDAAAVADGKAVDAIEAAGVADQKAVAAGEAASVADGKAVAAGAAADVADGKAEDALAAAAQAEAAALGLLPVGSTDWWPLRSSIQAGWIPGDGQELPRATFPDLAQAVIAGLVPVVTEAEWQADPLKRGSYTLGDGSDTIRVPDYNGKSAGSLGRVFLSGDGLRSAGVNGALQADQLGPMEFSVSESFSTATNLLINGSGLAVLPSGNAANIGPAKGVWSSATGNQWIRNTGDETQPRNVTGCFVIRAFGTVANPGSADAAQLASDYAALSAAFQALSGTIDFVILYPGGTEAAPGVIDANTRLIVPNPFPGFAVHVIPEHYIQTLAAWGDPGWYSAYYTTPTTEGRAWGIRAGQYNDGDIVVATGRSGTMTDGPLSGALFPQGQVNQGNAKFRLRVWKLKGQV